MFVFVLVFNACFLLCCISFFFCKGNIQFLPMTILFPIGGMSAKHLQKMVYKLPAYHPVMCAYVCVCYVCHHMKMYFIDFVCFFCIEVCCFVAAFVCFLPAWACPKGKEVHNMDAYVRAIYIKNALVRKENKCYGKSR